MDINILAAASAENQKYFFEQGFNDIPDGIKEEIKLICVTMADRLCCSFVIGFQPDGDIFFNIVKPEGALNFDEIGAELEIKSLKTEKEELFKALSLWYKIFRTENGEDIKKELLEKGKKAE